MRKSKGFRIPNGNPTIEAINKLRELNEIENLIDELNSKRGMSVEEFSEYLKKHQFNIPELEKLYQAIIALEDKQDFIQKELDELYEDLDIVSKQVGENNIS